MNDTRQNDEIDLLQLIETIWDGKWRVIAITAACVVVVLGFQVLGPAPSFVATTEIKPILAGDAEDYRQSNALGFFAVYRDIEARDQAELSAETRALFGTKRSRDRDREKARDKDREKARDRDRKNISSAVLDQLFIEQLENHHLLARAFKKYGLLVREEFSSDIDYERALTQLAATMSILEPVNKVDRQRDESRRHWTLQFEFNDQGKWLAALAEIKDIADNNVRNVLKSRFNNLYASAKQKRAFDMEDLDTQISILIAAYDDETEHRLAHLTEQAAIARKIGISKQASAPQTSIYQRLSTQGSENLVAKTDKIDNETQIYLRGYDALEKEIELIKLRQDKRTFIDGLLPLERKKLVLSRDQTPERAQRLFEKTPIMSSDKFQATSLDVNATEFEYKSKRTLALTLATLVGAMIGAVYVLVASAMRGRKETDVG